MKSKHRTRTIVLWLISIGLLVGMIITFTPSLGNIGAGAGQNAQGTVQLVVNGEQIRQAQVQQLRQNPLFSAVSEGPVADDLRLLLADTLVQNEVLSQAAAKNRVARGAIRSAVKDFRKARGVDGRANDQAYLSLIGSAGYTDQTFRDYLKQTLQERAFEDDLTEGVTVSDAEVQSWYDTHTSSYQTEERVKAREIVVADQAVAEALLQQLIGGADFATLARENSTELADRDGALGAAAGETEPQPIGRPGLPTAVSAAVFALQGPGITDVIEASGEYYIVSVEEYLPPAPRPFDEVADQVREDALDAKRSQVVQAELNRLVDAATVSVPPGSELSYDNPVVARVGDETITAAELDRATYTNPQIQQALSPQTADLITSFFKPAVLGQLIDTEVAYQAASGLGLQVVGSKAVVAQAALDYVSRDATATDQELQDYYDANEASFTIPAQAVATRVNFDSQDAAVLFRTAILGGTAVDEAAEAAGGTVQDLGTVGPGDLVTGLDTALFKTDAFEDLPSSDDGVSDVLVLTEPVAEDDTGDDAADTTTATTDEAEATDTSEDAAASDTTDEAADADGETAADASTEAASDTSEDEATDAADEAAAGADDGEAATPATKDVYVVLIAERTPERVRSFDEVRSQVEAAVLATKRQQLRTDWLAQAKENITVENLLAEVTAPATDDGAADAAGDAGDTTPPSSDDATEPTTDDAAPPSDDAVAPPSADDAAPSGSDEAAPPSDDAAPAATPSENAGSN